MTTTDFSVHTEQHGHQHGHGPANRGERVVQTAAPLFVRFPPTKAHAAVIVLHDMYGLTEQIETHCRVLSRRGYVTIAPYFYYETGGKEFRPDQEATARDAMALLTPEGLAADLSAAVDYLGRKEGIPPRSTGLLGVGTGAYLASWAATEHELAATVAFDPVGVEAAPWSGMPNLCLVLQELRTPWLGIVGSHGPLPAGAAHALSAAAYRSHGRSDVTVVPGHTQAEGLRGWDEAQRLLDTRLY